MGSVALLNDTSAWYHWGCTATSCAIHKRIRQLGFDLSAVPILATYQVPTVPATLGQFDDPRFFQQACSENPAIFRAIQSADVLVINGEGTIHHTTRPCIVLLYAAHAAKRYLGKPVHVINHSAYPSHTLESADWPARCLYQVAYRDLDFVAIREHRSREIMQRLGIASQLSFDCLPLTLAEDHPASYRRADKVIVLAGSVAWPPERMADVARYIRTMRQAGYAVRVLVGAQAFPAQDDENFIRCLRQQGPPEWELVQARSLPQWFDCIGSASVLVSGRFHHTIAAACLGVPVVLLESNTPKMQALAEVLDVEGPLRYQAENFLPELVERTRRALAQGPVEAAVSGQLREQAEHNFDGLRRLR